MVLFAQGILKSGLLFVFNFNRKKIKLGKIFKVGRMGTHVRIKDFKIKKKKTK